ADMNLGLAQRRAQAFRRAMLNRGVGADRMEMRAYGEDYPVADNASAAGRAQNRRIEVLFSDTDGKLPAR
ncbi:MAG: OmpA family protein, partial [Propionivibrio sp.]